MAVAAVWKYIKDNNLQVEGRGRYFIPDAHLAQVLDHKGKEVDGLKMMSFLKNNFSFHKDQMAKKRAASSQGRKPKRYYGSKKSWNNITKEFPISPALQAFTRTSNPYSEIYELFGTLVGHECEISYQ